MATLSELLKQLNELPIGNIYKKRINGKYYYYYQYFSNGKRYTKLVQKEEAESLKILITKRKQIQKQIKEQQARNVTLSKNSIDLTGYIMSGNRTVATYENGILISLNEKYAPLVIKRTHSIEKFLKLRVIDMTRTNARILKKVLNIRVDEEYKTPLFAYALSISDNYWFKPKHSKLKYDDVKFNSDQLFETSLKGEVNVFYHKTKLSPEITTTGSFEKGWKYVDDEWWLYKVGSDKELFSELFCSALAQLIGVNTVTYELDGHYIKCKNFAQNYNYEPMAALMDDNEDYEDVFSVLYNINQNIAKDYLKLIFFDAVVNNIDRHNENYGLLRNQTTGKIISLAPNYDNNLALIATTDVVHSNPRKDGFISLFIHFLKTNEIARELFRTIEFNKITLKDIENIINQIPIEVANKQNIAKTIMLRYEFLKALF